MTTSMGTWRIARVDKGAVRILPDGDTGAPDGATDDGGRVVPTLRDGTVEMTVGDPVVPAVGDRVVLAQDRALIMPRTSELVRDTVGKTSLVQVIAANVECILIVEHLEPAPALGRVERMLTIAHRCGVPAVVVLTKADLVTDADFWTEQVRSVASGAEVVAISATTGAGLGDLDRAIELAHALVVVGPSGAGKSTLVNALARRDVMTAGAVRGDGRGMHTTTHRELVALPGGRWLIDTPGVRSIGVVATDEAVAATFDDIERLAAHCRFRDCEHASEPECAVVEAIETGKLPPRRLDSWRSLRREATHQAARADARPAAGRTQQLKRLSRNVRALKKSGQIHYR